MSIYIITNKHTGQTMQARGSSMSEVINRVCNLLGWTHINVIKKGV